MKNKDHIQLKRLPPAIEQSQRIRNLVMRMKTSQKNNGSLLFQSNLSRESIRIELHDSFLDIKIDTISGK